MGSGDWSGTTLVPESLEISCSERSGLHACMEDPEHMAAGLAINKRLLVSLQCGGYGPAGLWLTISALRPCPGLH
jgi:hypothetical protein